MKSHNRWFMGVPLFFLVSCHAPVDEVYEAVDTPLLLELETSQLRIMQITDLHLTFGIDYNDRHTFSLIHQLADYSNPDLIVITGDLTMAPYGPILMKTLVGEMESLHIPWTFVFGNHESDFAPNTDYLPIIQNTEHLLFSPGISLELGGLGNFVIETTVNSIPFMNLYLLDSKAEWEGILSYDYLSSAQVDWIDGHLASDKVDDIPSLAFMHIPLVQYQDYINYPLIDGGMNESGVFSQGLDTGFFATIRDHGLTKGVFAGHDHLNNFSFWHEDILLAYGQVTGFNAYGIMDRGARIIDIDEEGTISSYLLLESELSDYE